MKTIYNLLLIPSIMCVLCMNLKAQIISTFAGNGVDSCAINEVQALNAWISDPEGLDVDLSGNVYVVLQHCNSILKIDGGTGMVTKIAGTWTWGSAGDGGLAINASLNFPRDVKVDPSGNIYITDLFNNKIRKINGSTGKISTVAGSGPVGPGSFAGDGGPATSAKLNFPQGLCLDSQGNIIFSDGENDRIRKVIVSTGKINTIAGTGEQGYSGDGGSALNAKIYYPDEICTDANDNIYFIDRYNHSVRKISAESGIITTVAGDGTAGYSGDGGPATIAQLKYPLGLEVTANGDMYIADLNYVIRRVDAATGIICTIAGTGLSGFSGDGGPAMLATLALPIGMGFDSQGSLYISDNNNDRIRKITMQGTFLSPPGFISGDTVTCKGRLYTYSIEPVSGATFYTWSVPSGWVGTSTDTSLTVTADSTDGYISVFAESGSGYSCESQLAVYGNPGQSKPTITQDGNNVTCSTTATSYQWYFNNTPIPNANGQTYTPPQTGYYQVEITDANECSAKSDSLYMKGSGIEDVGNSLPVTIYPNPFQDQLIIELEEYRDTHVEIVNLQGQNIQFVILKSTGTIINTTNMSVGMYLVKVKNDKGLAVRKFIKNKG